MQQTYVPIDKYVVDPTATWKLFYDSRYDISVVTIDNLIKFCINISNHLKFTNFIKNNCISFAFWNIETIPLLLKLSMYSCTHMLSVFGEITSRIWNEQKAQTNCKLKFKSAEAYNLTGSMKTPKPCVRVQHVACETMVMQNTRIV